MAVTNFEKAKANYKKNDNETGETPYSGTDGNTLAQLAAMQQGRNKALVLPTDKMVIRGCEITPVGLAIPDNLVEQDWVFVAESIAKLQASIQWIIGDLWVFATNRYGERDDLAEAIGKKPKTLSNWASVCRAFPDQTSRQRELSFTHHAQVAGRDDALTLLQQAVDARLSVSKLRELVQGEQIRPSRLEVYSERVSRMVSYGKTIKADEKQKLIKVLEAAIAELKTS